MDRFQLRVPRLVMINEKEPVEGKEVVRRVLPHHKTVHYLYEYSISGSAEQKLMEEINEKLCCSRVEGIYESQTPLMKDQLITTGDIQPTIKFNTRHFRVVAEAEKEVNKAIRMSREATAKPTLLCMLVDEEPKHMDYANWARYLHVPIGSVPSDAGLFGLDLLFARHLQRAGHALVCVEFELEAVAVTALVQRGRLLEAEGADDAVAFDSTAALPSDAYCGLRNTISAFDEGAAVDAALKILKQMLTD
ncbi:unnamed protein product, partial [Strongylus vulgaris]